VNVNVNEIVIKKLFMFLNGNWWQAGGL